MRHLLLCAVLVLSACASGPEQPVPPDKRAEPPNNLTAREKELLEMHDAIWELLGISREAGRELNAIVIRLKRNIDYNEQHRPELMKILPGTQPPRPSTREDFMARHKGRFELLGVSGKTQAELVDAMEWVWEGLHGENPSPELKERAEKVRMLMVPELPPCQDPGFLKRSGRP